MGPPELSLRKTSFWRERGDAVREVHRREGGGCFKKMEALQDSGAK